MSKYDYFNTNSFSVHQKIIHFIGRDKKVLDVACSQGILSKKMKENNCQIVGIELDFEAAKIAEGSCQELIIGDVELIQLNPKYENYFDVIIFADILEHLRDPWDVLGRFKKYLNDEGYIIIGILDIGHLRFFTEKSAKKMVKDAGLEITKFDLTVGDLKTFQKIFHTIGRIWPNLLAFQFLIIAKKDK